MGGGLEAAAAAMGGPGGLRQARRLCHWGPLVALAVVAVCSATAMADAALWYWPLDTAGGSVNFVVLLNWTVMILYNYFSAMFVGPGYVPLGWTPVRAASLRGWGWGGERERGGGGGLGKPHVAPLSRLCRALSQELELRGSLHAHAGAGVVQASPPVVQTSFSKLKVRQQITC